MTYARRWKFLIDVSGVPTSSRGDFSWTRGTWYKQTGKLTPCFNGFHASRRIVDATGYVDGDFLARVEVRGESIDEGDKSVHREMRIAELYHWTLEDAVALAVFAARKVLNIFENAHREDNRPRRAIELAEDFLNSHDMSDPATVRNAIKKASYAVEKARQVDYDSGRYDTITAAEAALMCVKTILSRESAYTTVDFVCDIDENFYTEVERWLRQRVSQKEQVA